MGIIYIGDRSVGKTHLAMELANPRSEYVKVLRPDYETLKGNLFDHSTGSTRPTDAAREIDSRRLEIEVKLPARPKTITLDWIDTPGEIWRVHWQQKNPEKWENFLKVARQSQGILLVLNPDRTTLSTSVRADYPTETQWAYRFEQWTNFFQYDCPKARHIVVCINKADLFCDLEQEASVLAFNPHGSQLTWQQRHDHVQKYFKPIQPYIDQISKSTMGLSVRCFITSIYSRPLLELPWIYLASYLEK